MSFLKELFEFMGENKKWWLLPILFVFIAVGALIVFSQGTAVAPFVYTLF